MNWVEPSVKIEHPSSWKKAIELAARNCYKSEDKITEDSCDEMVERLISLDHYAMLEHGTIYLEIPDSILKYYQFICGETYLPLGEYFLINPYSMVTYDNDKYYITTNYRVLVENNLEDLLQYEVSKSEYHEPRIMIRIICDRGVSHELIRHRCFSFAQESTRYCDYTKGKFDEELSYIIPRFIYDIRDELSQTIDPLTKEFRNYLLEEEGTKLIRSLSTEDRTTTSLLHTLARIEDDYFYYRTTDESYQLKPQEARYILPNGLKTEIIMTGFKSQWDDFLNKRLIPQAHPDMQYIAYLIRQELYGKTL